MYQIDMYVFRFNLTRHFRKDFIDRLLGTWPLLRTQKSGKGNNIQYICDTVYN